MRRSNGSAMVFALIMVSAVTTVVVATADLTMASFRQEEKRVADIRARYLVDAAVAKVETDYRNGLIAGLPTLTSVNVGGVSVSVIVTDNSLSIPKTLGIQASATLDGKTYSESRIVGMRRPPSPFYYAVFINGSDWTNDNVTTGAAGANGDVCINGTMPNRTGTYVFNGDLEVAGSILPPNITVTGTRWENAPPVAVPALVRAFYSGAATSSFVGDQNFVNPAFGAAGPRLWYVDGDVNIRGTVSGRGTVYATGNIDVTNNLAYATAADYIVLIAEGDVKIKGGATSFVGYCFTPNEFRTEGGTAKTCLRGGVVCRTINLSRPLTLTHDPRVWTDPGFGAAQWMPGF